MIKGDYKEADKCCMKAIQLMPDDPEAFVNMNNIMR
jgi:Flp pilus assembly protein TadD